MTTGSVVYDGTTRVTTSNTTNAYWGTKYTRSWSGVDRPPVVPEFKVLYNPLRKKWYKKRVRKQRKRLMEPHPYQCTIHESSSPIIEYHSGTGVKKRETSVLPQGSCIPAWGTTPWTSNDEIKLIAKLQERVYGGDFNPGIFLAELGESLHMIGSTAVKLARSYALLRKGLIKPALNALWLEDKRRLPRIDRGLAGTVLEVQYGWRPLMNDLMSAAETVAHQLYAPCGWRFRVRGVRGKGVNPYANGAAGVAYESCFWSVRKQIVVLLREQPMNLVLQSLCNIEQVVWERIPLSFVADWAVPIGSYLTARGIASKLRGQFVVSTWSQQLSEGVQLSPHGSVVYTKAYDYHVLSPIPSRRCEVSFTRTVDTSLPIPLPEFKGFRSVASYEHCLNGVSLLATAAKHDPDDVLKWATIWDRKRMR